MPHEVLSYSQLKQATAEIMKTCDNAAVHTPKSVLSGEEDPSFLMQTVAYSGLVLNIAALSLSSSLSPAAFTACNVTTRVLTCLAQR